METLSFPRYNAAEIVVHIRNKILTGADGKNLSKNDLSPNPKVKCGSFCMWLIYRLHWVCNVWGKACISLFDIG